MDDRTSIRMPDCDVTGICHVGEDLGEAPIEEPHPQESRPSVVDSLDRVTDRLKVVRQLPDRVVPTI
jgi:hypothetical protein